MFNQNQELVFRGESEHSFISSDGHFINLKKSYPAFYNKLSAYYNKV